MRRDYEYVDRATSICLTTTEKADRMLDKLTTEELEDADQKRPDLEVLLSVQSEYFEVEGSLTEMMKEFKKEHERFFGVKIALDRETWNRLWVDDLLTVRKVIWD